MSVADEADRCFLKLEVGLSLFGFNDMLELGGFIEGSMGNRSLPHVDHHGELP